LERFFSGLFKHQGLGQWGLFSRSFSIDVVEYDAGELLDVVWEYLARGGSALGSRFSAPFSEAEAYCLNSTITENHCRKRFPDMMLSRRRKSAICVLAFHKIVLQEKAYAGLGSLC
jgi:hypothetical protein